ncbi:MAG: hypothetical protein ACREPE_12990 [Lysobacter sp.]
MALLSSPRRWLALSVLAGTLALAIGGHAAAAEPLKLTDSSFLELDEFATSSKGRPNEEWRWQGLKSYQVRQYAEAVQRFERAASYADKYSQHYLSLLYWHGAGVSRDRVLAYIWSDLAAERGSKPLLLIREKMWSGLSPDEQKQVGVRGEEFYARYGDEVAKPRAEAQITRFARNITGSKVGFQHKVDIQAKPVTGAFSADTGSNASAYNVAAKPSVQDLYPEKNRDMMRYWREQDALMGGTVDVGRMQTVRKPGGQ